MLDAAYMGQPYHGEVCLHFAIVHNDLEMVKAAGPKGRLRRGRARQARLLTWKRLAPARSTLSGGAREPLGLP